MDNILTYSIFCLTSLFTLVVPLGTMLVFMEMTDRLDGLRT